ncbi:MAG: hypothetical protein ACYTAF_01795 [Planctomycetota bacterium]
MRRTAGILVLSVLAAAFLPAQQQEQPVYVEEVRPDFLERVKAMVEAQDWRSLHDLYRYCFKRYRHKNVRVERTYQGRKVVQWVSLVDHLIALIAALPHDALEIHRLEYDGPMLSALDRARESGDLTDLETGIDPMFFSSHTDEALDFLANRHFQEGRVHEARYYWTRLLLHCPDTDLPRATIAARAAVACREAGDERGLADLLAWFETSDLDPETPVFAAGESRPLGAFLKSVKIDAPSAAVPPKEEPGKAAARPSPRPWTTRSCRRTPRWTAGTSSSSPTASAPSPSIPEG